MNNVFRKSGNETEQSYILLEKKLVIFKWHWIEQTLSWNNSCVFIINITSGTFLEIKLLCCSYSLDLFDDNDDSAPKTMFSIIYICMPDRIKIKNKNKNHIFILNISVKSYFFIILNNKQEKSKILINL